MTRDSGEEDAWLSRLDEVLSEQGEVFSQAVSLIPTEMRAHPVMTSVRLASGKVVSPSQFSEKKKQSVSDVASAFSLPRRLVDRL